MADNRTPAECFPPGKLIAEELEARGWSHQDLADKCLCPRDQIDAVIDGTTPFTPFWASKLACALGWSADFLMRLEESYQAFKAKEESCQSKQ